MVFGDDGRLTERRIVLMPKGETLARETYAADGTVKRLRRQGQGVGLGAARGRPRPHPDVKPDTSALVVLPLPLRTREVVYRRLEFNPNQPLSAGENACHAYLNPDDALELFAAEYAAQNAGNARTVYEDCFAGDAARTIGFHVLLAACGDRTARSPQLQALRSEAKRERDPLLLYLTLLNLPEYRTWQPYLGLDLAGGPLHGHPFLGPLAAFSDQWLPGHLGQVDATKPGTAGSANGSGAAWSTSAPTRGRRWLGAARRARRPHCRVGHALRGGTGRRLGPVRRPPGARLRGALRAPARCSMPAGATRPRASSARCSRGRSRRRVLPAVDATFREALGGKQAEADLVDRRDDGDTAADFCNDHRRPARSPWPGSAGSSATSRWRATSSRRPSTASATRTSAC